MKILGRLKPTQPQRREKKLIDKVSDLEKQLRALESEIAILKLEREKLMRVHERDRLRVEAEITSHARQIAVDEVQTP